MSDPKTPVPGDLVIDASDLSVVDVTPDRISTMLKFRDGVARALANIERLKVEEMERAGLNEKDVERARALIAEHRRAEQLLPAITKLAELIYETKMDRADQLCQLMGELGSQARRRARRDPRGGEVLGPLADLLAYQYGPAAKAVATRQKAKAAKTSAIPLVTKPDAA